MKGFGCKRSFLAKLIVHSGVTLRSKISWCHLHCSTMILFNTHFNQPNDRTPTFRSCHLNVSLRTIFSAEVSTVAKTESKVSSTCYRVKIFFSWTIKTLSAHWINRQRCCKPTFIAPSAGIVWPQQNSEYKSKNIYAFGLWQGCRDRQPRESTLEGKKAECFLSCTEDRHLLGWVHPSIVAVDQQF